LAALATVGAAQAQSSVTVYGIVDTGYGWIDRQGVSTAGARTTYDTAAPTDSQSTSSRLGFRGTEDLGGGLKANFVVETGLAAMGSSVIGDGTTTANNRQAFVSLQSAAGTVGVGTQYTPFHTALAALTASTSGLNNVVGDLTYKNGPAYTVRANSFTFSTTQGPVRADVIFGSSKGDDSDNTKDVKSSLLGAGLTYTQGPVRVLGVYQSVTSTADAASISTANQAIAYNVATGVGHSTLGSTTAGSIGPYLASAFTATSAAVGVKQKANEYLVGGSYTTGGTFVSLSYAGKEVDNRGNASGSNDKRTMTQLGLRQTVGKVGLFGSYSDGELKIDNNSAAKADLKGFQLGADYSFSKRTAAYTIYGKEEAKVGANKAERTQLAVGIRHSF